MSSQINIFIVTLLLEIVYLTVVFFLVCNQFVKCPSHHKTNKNNYVFIFTNLLSTPALLKILFHLFCFVENKIHLISFEYNLLIEKQPLFIKCSLVAH